MDNRGKRQAASIFGGMGFYIALLVCVVAAGVVGYFALLNDETETVNDPLQMVDQLTPGPSQAVVEPDPEPARPVISDQPVTVIRQEPPEETEPEPDPALEAPVSAPVQEPVMAQELARHLADYMKAGPITAYSVSSFSDGRALLDRIGNLT